MRFQFQKHYFESSLLYISQGSCALQKLQCVKALAKPFLLPGAFNMMGLPQTESSTPPHLYPEAIQLKLYQAFIFSIPILFSVILILLFYLFYLKRRASNLSPLPANLTPATNQGPTYFPTGWQLDKKEELKDKLVTVVFDEELQNRDTLCCVCLGEFQLKEELQQVTSCRHVFHEDCLHHWLHSNSTCPLCRCSVFPTAKPQLQTQNSDSTNTGGSAISSIAGSSNADSFVVHIPSSH